MTTYTPLLTKSTSFSKHAIKIHLELVKTEFRSLAIQLLKSSTSIGANIEEAQGAGSRKEFIQKFRIAYREARESRYWIKLFIDSGVINVDLSHHLDQCQQLERLLVSAIKSSSANT